jgi:hypothetical protein
MQTRITPTDRPCREKVVHGKRQQQQGAAGGDRIKDLPPEGVEGVFPDVLYAHK